MRQTYRKNGNAAIPRLRFFYHFVGIWNMRYLAHFSFLFDDRFFGANCYFCSDSQIMNKV